ncbi:hypothetical protein PT277_06825 [Acetobacteraceae bacterium ESL0709]|nr:hypothetical protein [Acetobacteraceae bacterium ESL0709]
MFLPSLALANNFSSGPTAPYGWGMPRMGGSMARSMERANRLSDALNHYDHPQPSPPEHYTQGYIRRNGQYVQGHYSTIPNHTKLDNWSTRGNINPHTGRRGYRSPY